MAIDSSIATGLGADAAAEANNAAGPTSAPDADARRPDASVPTASVPAGCLARVSASSTPCDGGAPLGYFAMPADNTGSSFHCALLGVQECLPKPLPFATLVQCVSACEPGADHDATGCTEASQNPASCAPDGGAELARLDADTPFGPLALRHAFIERVRGFTYGITVIFTTGPDARLDARPSFGFELLDPIDSARDLVGSHDVAAGLALCGDRSVQLPVRVHVAVDEIVPHVSERFEGTLESLDPSVALSGEFRFSRVCLYSTDT